MKSKYWIIAIALMMVLTGCGKQSAETFALPVWEQPTEQTTQATTEAPVSDPIGEILDTMTLEEKVGQMFLICPESIGVSVTPEEITEGLLTEYPVGGIMISKSNMLHPVQVVTLLDTFQNCSKYPLFMAVDEEGGTVARFANHGAFPVPKYDSAAAVGASGDPNDALSMGQTIGGYLKDYHINMNFAPVADVFTNPYNTVIGDRAFSTDPQIVTQMSHAMAEGLRRQNIIPVFKHFPGHGDTAEDSHSRLAVSYKTLEELEACEWLPYEGLTDMDCVMVAHVALPNVTGDMLPASLSYGVVTELLREKLGFTGLVITDGMEMGAIVNTYSPGEASIRAIAAGCDVILEPADFPAAYGAVVEAVQQGQLTEGRIDESVYRILSLKAHYGILS